MAQRGGEDALGGLLSFSGLDTSAFSRPKSLADMKTKQAAPTPVQASARAAAPASGVPAHSSSPLRPPPASQAPAASPDPLALDLDALVTGMPKSASRASLGGASVSSLASAPGRLPTDTGGGDDLDSLLAGAFASPTPAPAPTPASMQSPAAYDDPLLDFLGVPLQPSPARSAASPATAPAAGMADLLGGDLLGGFGAPPAPKPAATPPPPAAPRVPMPQPTIVAAGAVAGAPAAAAAAHSTEQPSSPDAFGFGDFTGPAPSAAPKPTPTPAPAQPAAASGSDRASPDRRPQPGPTSASPAPAPRAPAAQAAAPRLGAQAEAGMTPPLAPRGGPGLAGPVQSPSQHKAFDYLDQHEEQSRRARGGASGGAGFSARAEAGYDLGAGWRSGSEQQSAAAAAAEVKQKAAKMLHAGTQWFMRAGKTFVKDLQSTIAKHQQGSQQQPRQGSDATPPYYYDWAAQLTRLSPNSRSSALGAMAEDDRLVVQRIIDEAALGETYLEATLDTMAEQQQQQPRSREGSHHSLGSSSGRREEAVQQQQQAQAQPASQSYSRSSSRHAMPSEADSDGESLAARPSPRPARSHDGSAAGSARGPPSVPSYGQLYEDAPARAAEAVAAEAAPPPPPPAPAAEADLLGFADGPARRPAPRVAASAATAAAAQAPAPGWPAAAVGGQGDDDLLGFGAGAPAPAAAAAADGGMEDLLGFGGPANKGAGAPPAPARHRDIEDMFKVPGAAAAGASTARPAAAAAAAPRRPAAGGGLDSMIDLGAELPAVDVGEHAALYEDGEQEVEDPNEPEIRRRLRQRRIQEKHARMQRQLAEKRAREEAEESEKAGKVELREQLKPKIDAWAAGKKDNIRALLSSLHMVLWEGSGWSAPNMSDMVDNHKVKRLYMKANLIVHPDKVKQKGGTLEQITVADMVFDVLKMAWGKFEGASG